jgi:hypothetical protein
MAYEYSAAPLILSDKRFFVHRELGCHIITWPLKDIWMWTCIRAAVIESRQQRTFFRARIGTATAQFGVPVRTADVVAEVMVQTL